MKRFLSIILCLLLSCAFAEVQPLTEEELYIVYAETLIRPGLAADGIIRSIESADQKSMDVFSAPSCLYTGRDKEFTGRELMIATYPIGENGGDVIESVLVMSGNTVTSRGIGIGDSLEKVLSAYGDPVWDGDQAIYCAGDHPERDPVLIFAFENGAVSWYLIMANTGFGD